MGSLEKGNRVLQVISVGRNKEKTDEHQDESNCNLIKSNYSWLESKLCSEPNCKLAKFNYLIDSLNFTLTIVMMLMLVMTKFNHWNFIHPFKTTC